MKGTFLNVIRPFFKYLFILILLGSVFSYAMFQGGFVSWFLFYSVTTVLLYTVVVAILPFKVRGIERILSKETVHSGEDVDVTVIIHKRRFQPFFFVRIQDAAPELLRRVESSALFFFSFQRQLVFSYTIPEVRRGAHSFGNVTLVIGDLFGLFERRVTQKCETTVLVYPRVRKLKAVPSSGSPRQLEGIRASQSYQEDRSLAGVRQYVPGDRLTSIDWKQSARLTNLMTKEFESFQGEGVLIAFDSFLSKSSKESFEHAVELTASLMTEFAKGQSTLRLAVRSQDFVSFDVRGKSLAAGLKLLAQVEPNSKPLPTIHRIYREWQGMHVYFVCAELDKQTVLACKTILEQKGFVSICMVSNADPVMVNELEKMGITVYVLENE
ncbi:DUF58 domain-containing protein [Halalkalibacter nanhaiisediminis]|uniref:Uncharacterized protein (DUF58 family) n=1 Tax=Halalkalibacter nanhaiisediminis TaxID=688079 RepID=A0A562QB79_9BACI|nr:DUF58 domain-containing protein [Halalkalibacter nanhaiisediminis]TWI53998.1 uncharacterized protein (DUF58 family) [Halalkalibacter nanhaiisediminis]